MANNLLDPWLDPAQLAVEPDGVGGWHEKVIRSLAVTGVAPFTLVRTFTPEEEVDPSVLVPPELQVIADSVSDSGRVLLMSSDAVMATATVRGQQVELYAAASSPERRDEVDRHYGELFPATRDEPDLVQVQFAYDEHRLVRNARWVRAKEWSEVRAFYTAPAAELLEQVIAVNADPSGRVILLHGPPGTGKSSLLMTLARAWREWCDVTFVLDAEHLLGGPPRYLMGLALDSTADRWQLIVIEDAGELLRPTADGTMHAGLARLLNLTDGALGQGLRLIVCITTNEPLSGVHPALRRPGRCLAEIHVGELEPDEANALLCPGRHTTRPMTLAEVLERRGELQRFEDEEDVTAPMAGYL